MNKALVYAYTAHSSVNQKLEKTIWSIFAWKFAGGMKKLICVESNKGVNLGG